MKKVKQLKGWGIFENNKKEVAEYGFSHTVLHPDNMDYPYMCTPHDSDMECNSLEEAVQWIENYNK
jgi:hypothetical protein